jgi:peptidylprolyl isomerase/FKBP-type peptidyl-prolyl cis-trans isomerase FklB
MRFAPLIALVALSLCACGPSKADVAANAQATANKAAADAYMAKAAKEPGVKALPSGVLYKVVRSGPATGPHPKLSDEIKIHYEGKIATTGKVFDTTYEEGTPRDFPLAMLIPAWKEALVQMRPGDEWILMVPPEQGYGAESPGPEIPANSALIFRIELIGILSHPQIGQG